VAVRVLHRHHRHAQEDAMRRALHDVAAFAQEVKVLGSYPVAIA
jgi:chorismate mutase/prephenate dehydratase